MLFMHRDKLWSFQYWKKDIRGERDIKYFRSLTRNAISIFQKSNSNILAGILLVTTDLSKSYQVMTVFISVSSVGLKKKEILDLF